MPSFSPGAAPLPVNALPRPCADVAGERVVEGDGLVGHGNAHLYSGSMRKIRMSIATAAPAELRLTATLRAGSGSGRCTRH